MKIFSQEAVSSGHPDKLADQISDALLDACLKLDPRSKVACETLISHNQITCSGEISGANKPNFKSVITKMLTSLGYFLPELGLDPEKTQIITHFQTQSPELKAALHEKEHLRASDQAIVYGYATDETSTYMPLEYHLSKKILKSLLDKKIEGLYFDAKTLINLQNDKLLNLTLSIHHDKKLSLLSLRRLIDAHIHKELYEYLTPDTRLFINPGGDFHIGGAKADTGVTGRKIIQDTYGCNIPHGGGAFSGKDPSKIDRTGAYLARYIAKNLVYNKLAKKCLIRLTYSIGIKMPTSIEIETFSTETKDKKTLLKTIENHFPLAPSEATDLFKLFRPIYLKTAAWGPFEMEAPWEKTIKI